MSIATRLDEAMKKAGLKSQMDLSRASGVPQPTIARILKKPTKKGPETDTLVRLARACNVSVEWLRDGREARAAGRWELIDAPSEVPPAVAKASEFRRHWLSEDEAEFLAHYRSLTARSRKVLWSSAKGLKFDAIDTDIADEP